MRAVEARIRLPHRATASLLAVFALIATGGCTTTNASRDANADTASLAGTPNDLASPPALVVGAIEPTTRSVAARDLVRAEGSVARYEIVAGESVGGEVIERMTREVRPELPPAFMRHEERGGRIAERMLLSTLDDGTFRLERVDSILDRSRSEFTDPLVFAAELTPTKGINDESPMSVFTLPALRKRAEGTARRSLTIAGECDLTLWGQRVRAIALDLAFDVELDVAVATVRSRMYVVPGRGVVAEAREESRRVLGLFRTTSSETIVLRSVEEDATPAGATTP
ncbi:MAG: hypothetical protein ACKO3W_03085 [bacterium]